MKLIIFVFIIFECIFTKRVTAGGRMLQEYIKNPMMFQYAAFLVYSSVYSMMPRILTPVEDIVSRQ